MKYAFITLGLVGAVMLFASCKPDDGADVCIAGTGGNITIVTRPRHHSKAVRPYAVWVKYNSKDAPGVTAANYDLTRIADTALDHVRVTGMKCGDYYFYMNGYDTAIRESVRGGIPFTVPAGSTGEVIIDVPVTE